MNSKSESTGYRSLRLNENLGATVRFKACHTQNAAEIPTMMEGKITGFSLKVRAGELTRLKIFYLPRTGMGLRVAYIFDVDLSDPYEVTGKVVKERE